MTTRLSAKQREALATVAAGRVEYGALYPRMARRAAEGAAARGEHFSDAAVIRDYLVDGSEVYGAAKGTYRALEERGLIRPRTEDLPTERVPARRVTRQTFAGPAELVELPEHDRPADPGWRVPMILTDEGRATVE